MQGDMLEENFRPYNVLHADNFYLEDNVTDKLEEKKIVREFNGLYISYRTPQNMGFLQKATLVNISGRAGLFDLIPFIKTTQLARIMIHQMKSIKIENIYIINFYW